MKRKNLRFISLLLILFIFISFILFSDMSKSRLGAISIEASPSSTVFLNGQQVGRTPYDGEFRSGEVTLRLVPEKLSDTPLTPFESKVKIAPGIKTIVRRVLGQTRGDSFGQTLSFSRSTKKEASLSVITSPDSAKVFLDNIFINTSPVKLSDISPGAHKLKVTAKNYKETELEIKITPNHNLTAIIDLQSELNENKITETKEEPRLREVEIQNTPTGFLRVRSKPNTSGIEVDKVSPGEIFPLLEKNETTGWFKIDLGKSVSGWVSGTYAKETPP